MTQLQQRGQQDALLREKQSIMLLRQLVVHSLQVCVCVNCLYQP